MACPNPPRWLQQRAGGVVLLLTVQPAARRTELAGLHDGLLRVRLAAPALEGRANEALRAWLAGQLGCARSAVQLLRGETSRRKQVAVELPVEQVCARIEQLLAQAQSRPG